MADSVASKFVVRAVEIPGISQRELVYVLKTELDSLAESQKELFQQ